jgi:hypothetical protein
MGSSNRRFGGSRPPPCSTSRVAAEIWFQASVKGQQLDPSPLNETVASTGDKPLHGLLEFPDISRPRARSELRNRLRAENDRRVDRRSLIFLLRGDKG